VAPSTMRSRARSIGVRARAAAKLTDRVAGSTAETKAVRDRSRLPQVDRILGERRVAGNSITGTPLCDGEALRRRPVDVMASSLEAGHVGAHQRRQLAGVSDEEGAAGTIAARMRSLGRAAEYASSQMTRSKAPLPSASSETRTSRPSRQRPSARARFWDLSRCCRPGVHQIAGAALAVLQ